MKPLILASSSPRRRELCDEAGIVYEKKNPCADEGVRPGEGARSLVTRVARAKAADVAEQFPRRLVLSADTVVSVADRILGKPGSAERTREMIRALSGRTHEVLTAVVLVQREPSFFREHLVVSQVTFRDLSAEDVEAYVASGDGLDKAGGYGIQSRGHELIEGYEGSYSNIVGLPLSAVRELLAAAEAAGLYGA